MLSMLALAAAISANPIVSTGWLQDHLNDPNVRVIYVGDRASYDRGHIPGARLLDYGQTMNMGGGRHMESPDALVKVFTAAGAADEAHVVLYGDTPMATGWVSTALMSLGHGADISWLDGSFNLWTTEKRPVSTSTPAPGTGPLTARVPPDAIVDSAYVRSHLDSATTKILDVRTDQEWQNGHLPNATLILWQDLFQDPTTLKFKSPEDIRALLTHAGLKPGQEVVTYCAIGMRASLMFWAAQSAGIPARVYVGSWQDWSRDATNPVVK
jgi:thiosulfate/3-mercaptopyruvate sulfurtransferase